MAFVKAISNISHNLKNYVPGDVFEVTEVQSAQLVKSGAAKETNAPETPAPAVKPVETPKPKETAEPKIAKKVSDAKTNTPAK